MPSGVRWWVMYVSCVCSMPTGGEALADESYNKIEIWMRVLLVT